MKFQIAPVKVSNLVPFSSSLNSSNDPGSCDVAFSGISKNGLWMWVVCDTVINFYHTENSKWFGGYCFGKSLKKSAQITAVVEFCSSHITFPCLLISVNNDHESLVCMCNINASKVVRAILVPEMVRSLEVVSGNGGAVMDTHHLFVQLRYMFGIVAVGTTTGHLYFLDLCLDEDFTCDETLPNISYVLKKYELLPEIRESVISRPEHIFMLLNDQSTRNGSFEFESRSSSLGHFPCGKVQVTAIKYIQSTVTLAIGFNFGGIQLWNLQDLCLLYTVANQPQEQAIIAFAFQEPENDPRHFCYLWVIRGHLANERPEDFSVATMYSLIYGKRTFVESFGNLYTELLNCTKRFEYRMTSDPYSSAQSSSTAGSCLLSCQTVCQTDEIHLSDANESDIASENMSLCFLSWLVCSASDNFPSSYHLALFDLNQWYRAEMPSSNLRYGPSALNPYFAHFSLEEVAQIFDSEPILGVHAIPHSVKKFKFISPSEEFFYPSSLDFQAVMFSANGICKTTFIGLQKRLLYEIADMAPSVLSNPKEFYSDLMRSGLISDIHGTSERVPLIIQREGLLQLALEYHMPYFFMKCLKEWRYADSIQEGCTSRALLNWAWKKVIYIKNNIDKLNIPLFNCSGCDVDKASLKCLYGYRRQLDLIDTILMGYQKFATPRTEQGIQELKCRKDCVFSINIYLQVLLWLRSVHVLPEVCEGEEMPKNVLYPVNALVNSYAKRRNQLQKIHNSIGPTDILLIDGLVKQAFSENTWQEKGGNGIYPPPSIYAALSCYLLDDVHLELKHSLMYYLLLDICNSPNNVNSPFVAEVKKFPVVFGMSQSVSKLVKAFWCLDQFDFEVAIKRLLQPAVKAADILPWQHHRVIKSFLFQREAQKALKYINHMDPPENTIEDMKLHLSVLLSRGAITQAFYYQRSKQSQGFGTELLNHLFLGCKETCRLKEIMYLPLNAFESSTLVKFLSENDDPCAQEALVMYYLLHCNFFEAARINEKLLMSAAGKSVSTRERNVGREALVESFLSTVPNTEKNLVNEINRFPSYPAKKGESLKPLSLSVKSAPLKQITYSDIISSLISDASSVMCAPYLEPQTPFKTATKSHFDSIPFLRPPLTPEPTRISTETVYTTPVTKRTLTSPSSEFSSPSKKSRLLDNTPFKMSPLSKKKIPKHLAGDVASLLQSPPIHRRGSKPFKEGIRNSPVSAPHGILKKKVQPSKPPLSDVFTSRTPSVLSDAGESSDDGDEEQEKMAIDEELDDIPGRQIRFSVPRKDDLSASAISVDTDTSVNQEIPSKNVFSESSGFLRKLDDLKPRVSLGSFNSGNRDFINVTQRKTSLSNLTREPLKAHCRQTIKERLSCVESDKKMYETISEPQHTERFSFSSRVENYSSQSKVTMTSELVDISDSNSSQALESTDLKFSANEVLEVQERDSGIASVLSSGCLNSSTPTKSTLDASEPVLQPLLNVTAAEQSLNISGSSKSSYNSAVSERSFVITPRRPLRDKKESSSETSMVSIAEGERATTLLGSEMRESEDEDNDVSIIEEVSAPPSNNIANAFDNLAEESSVQQRRTSIEFVEEIDNMKSDIEICEVPIETETISYDRSSYVIDVVEYSQSASEGTKDVNISAHSDYAIQDITENAFKIKPVESTELTNFIEDAAKEVIDLIEKQVDESFDSTEKEILGSSQENMPEQPVKDVHESDAKVTPESLSEEIPESPPKDSTESFPTSFKSLIPEAPDASDSPKKDDSELSMTNIPEQFDLTKDVPIPTPRSYVPLKERIKSSDLGDVEFSDFEADDPLPSRLLAQIEHQIQDDAFESKESDVLEEYHATVEKSMDVESVDDMEAEAPESKNFSELLSTPTLTSTQKFSQRCELLSNDNDSYESSRLYKDTVDVLQETVQTPHSFDFFTGKNTSKKTRTFVFEKMGKVESSAEVPKTSTLDNTNPKMSEEQSKTPPKIFLESWHPETYEQFSSSIQKGSSDDNEQKNLKSSPNASTVESSVSLFDRSTGKQSVSGARGRSKKQESTKKSSVGKQKSSIKKAKGKVISQKMEFSFAAPHSPAGPEILEALSTPSQHPVGSFMFSPPLTRGRLRQKKHDETFGSSFASVASETSFSQDKKPPIDSILEDIMAEKAPETKNLTETKKQSEAKKQSETNKTSRSTQKSKAKSSTRKKSTEKKTSGTDVSQLETTDASLNTSNVAEESADLSASSHEVLSSLKYVAQHRMVLRHTKAKPRTRPLF